MSLGFPTRFLKKLDIYQQIRSGQGISKHKKLWKYEAAFLQTSYSEKHQYLNSCVESRGFREWITRSEPRYDGEKYEEIIGNLFWRGYLDVIDKNNGENLLKRELGYFCNKDLAHWVGCKMIEKDTKNLEGGNEKEFNKILNNIARFDNDFVVKFKKTNIAEYEDCKKETSKKLKEIREGRENNEFRATQEGLLVGEVWSEINNKIFLLKYWNKYRYSLTLDIFWLLIFLGIVSIFFKDELTNFIKTLKETSIPVCSLDLGHNFLVVFLIFAFWPFVCWLYREIYLAIENR